MIHKYTIHENSKICKDLDCALFSNRCRSCAYFNLANEVKVCYFISLSLSVLIASSG